ncbi:MAG: DUF799 family lipoprotein [Desulfuromonadales bacterium]|nr:DUF799 family lipoprotein [Desulfuromonadales bacterium]
MMQKKLFSGLWFLCCATFLLTGCAVKQTYTSEQMDFSAVRTVAVLPFQNLTSDDQASERVRDAFMVVLLASEGIYVLPPGEVARGVNRVGIRTPATPNVEEITKLQSVIGVDAVITGVLREYGAVRSGSAEANLVSLSLQMIETQTGTIVWSGASTRGGITMTDRLLGSGGEPMDDVTIQVVNDLLNQLFE